MASEDSNTGGSFSSSAIAQIKLNEPSLVITKGVVSTSSTTAAFTTTPAPPGVTFAAPGTTTSPPFSGLINTTNLAVQPDRRLLANAQGNDLVRFAIVVENVGAGQLGAFNVTIRGRLSHLACAQLHLCRGLASRLMTAPVIRWPSPVICSRRASF